MVDRILIRSYPRYLAEQSVPDQANFSFGYTIEIENQGNRQISPLKLNLRWKHQLKMLKTMVLDQRRKRKDRGNQNRQKCLKLQLLTNQQQQKNSTGKNLKVKKTALHPSTGSLNLCTMKLSRLLLLMKL